MVKRNTVLAVGVAASNSGEHQKWDEYSAGMHTWAWPDKGWMPAMATTLPVAMA